MLSHSSFTNAVTTIDVLTSLILPLEYDKRIVTAIKIKMKNVKRELTYKKNEKLATGAPNTTDISSTYHIFTWKCS